MPRLSTLLTFLFASAAAIVHAAPPTIVPQPFVAGLASPLEITHARDSSGRLFVVEQGGKIRVIRNGALLPAAFLDLSAGNGGPVLTGGEQGLLGLAFHPGYAVNGRFYVFYTRARAGDPGGNEAVIARYSRSAANPDLADPASGTVVLTYAHPQQSNHNGGKLAFGPDGYLYIGTGDGGGGGDPFATGQSITEFRGKLLRIDVDQAPPYQVPPTNPYALSALPGVRPEIWALGLRNPWRFSFDRATGDLFIGDVGQGAWEEIDYQPAGVAGGRNYGWSVFEGSHCYPPGTQNCSLANHTLPIIEYGHDSATGGFSVTGGYRYRGGAMPSLAGYYVYGDYVTGKVWAASPDGGGTWTTTQVASVSNLSAFGEDQDGELYAANLVAGTIQRLTPAATNAPRLGNVSTRMQVLTGDDVLIGGFIIGGSTPKTVVVRARGPSLAAFGIVNPLANPTLQLIRSSDQAVLATNDDWASAANAAQLVTSGFAPGNALESAILATLAPGGYTAIVSGFGGGTGVGIVEVFEVDHPEVPLANIATRGQVLNGDDVMIGGFVIQGTGPQTVIVRARGPSLAGQGIANPLANPTLLVVRSSDQFVVGSNDDWASAANAAQVASSGFAPANALESAVLVTLLPGAYTAIVRGANGGTGVGLVEMFAW